MAELNINWETIENVPVVAKKAPKVVTGEGTTAPVAAPDESGASEPAETLTRTDKPYMIYVTDVGSDPTMKEKVILDDDRVKLGARAFHAVKMSPDTAKADPLLADKGGKEVPRFIFVSADQKSVKAVEGGTLSLGEVWSTMKAVSNKSYKQDLDAIVKGLRDVLNEFDKAYKERSVLDEKEKRLADKATPADKKDIEAKRAELDAREKKAQAMKEKLWDLKPREEKA